MVAAGIAGVSRRKFVATTVKGSCRQAPHLVERNFRAESPNLRWVADITYIPTWAGFLHLAPSLMVPAEALIFNRDGLQVAVVDNGISQIRKMRVTRELGTQVEVHGVGAGGFALLAPHFRFEGWKCGGQPRFRG